jgi:hypothetical protein
MHTYIHTYIVHTYICTYINTWLHRLEMRGRPMEGHVHAAIQSESESPAKATQRQQRARAASVEEVLCMYICTCIHVDLIVNVGIR